jgi:hypothetical protein
VTATDQHHEEIWLLLPWLASGRLGAAERAQAEEHVRSCPACAAEVAVQQRLCSALTLPERVTYAPGASFRKLAQRLDGEPRSSRVSGAAALARHAVAARERARWRPPGIAWAASVLLTATLATLAVTTYHWSQPSYVTYTSSAPSRADVLHIAFVPSLPVGEVSELLQAAGAHVVEGPDRTGIFAVAPLATPAAAGSAGAGLRALAARLRTDARVRWVEPLPSEERPAPP